MLFLRYIHCTVCYYTNAMPEERKNLWRFDGSAVWPCKPYNSCNLPFRPRSSGNLIFALNYDVPVATMLVLVLVTSDFVLISVISQGFLTSNEIIGTMLISRSKKKKKRRKNIDLIVSRRLKTFRWKHCKFSSVSANTDVI